MMRHWRRGIDAGRVQVRGSSIVRGKASLRRIQSGIDMSGIFPKSCVATPSPYPVPCDSRPIDFLFQWKGVSEWKGLVSGVLLPLASLPVQRPLSREKDVDMSPSFLASGVRGAWGGFSPPPSLLRVPFLAVLLWALQHATELFKRAFRLDVAVAQEEMTGKRGAIIE